MRIIFIGSVSFSAFALRELISMGVELVGVCTLTKSSFNADFEDLTPISQSANIPVCPIEDVNSPEAIEWINSKSPDVIFCFGWSRLIREPLLSLPPLGVLGFHPSALPANRGRHPIIWALVLGLSQTASTFFKMDRHADSGDIISQVMIDIYPDDNASTLYKRISLTAINQLREFVPLLASGTVRYLPQEHSISNHWRKRGAKDGCIDWRMAATSIHDLVRGLTRPYIGAHFDYNGLSIKVWRTEIISGIATNLEPGKILDVSESSFLVKTGIDAIRVIEYSPQLSLHPGSYL